VDRQFARRLLAELLGTSRLVIAVVGSATAAQETQSLRHRLPLLENAAATGAALVTNSLAFG
jgi:glycerol uptake facilitator-like aquaporin